MPATICARHVRETRVTAAMMVSFRLVIGAYRAMMAARRVQAPVAVIRAGLDSGVALVTTRVQNGCWS